MTDLYIATKTQADYDALMRLAEAAGYMWNGNEKPTQFNAWPRLEGGTVINLVGNKVYYEPLEYLSSENCAIETIPNLADIGAICKVQPKDLQVFSDENLNTSDIIKDWALNDGVIILLENGSYDLGFEEVYKTLAVEYKPKESEDIMPEKVKLPRNVIDVFSPALDSPGYRILGSLTPIRIISDMYNRTLIDVSSDVATWLNDYDNQWKLIDALRYGYEAEPEQLYYVPLIKNDDYYLNLNTETGKAFLSNREQGVGFQTKLTMPEIIAIDPRYKAFAIPVEEVDE